MGVGNKIQGLGIKSDELKNTVVLYLALQNVILLKFNMFSTIQW
jgi:hypothetical protein